MSNQSVKSLEEARKWFDDNGVSVSEWCRAKNLNRLTVVNVLHGRCKGLRGDGHKAAVALGVKADPKQEIAA